MPRPSAGVACCWRQAAVRLQSPCRCLALAGWHVGTPTEQAIADPICALRHRRLAGRSGRIGCDVASDVQRAATRRDAAMAKRLGDVSGTRVRDWL